MHFQDRTIRLWNPHKGTFIKSYLGHGYEVRDIAVFKDNSKLASVGGDKQVFLWDVASGQVIRKFRGHDSTINAVRHKQRGKGWPHQHMRSPDAGPLPMLQAAGSFAET
jgi:WD40 repeat protein